MIATRHAVLFDMDGTLLEPHLHNNPELLEYKQRWGIATNELIVPSLGRLPPEATTQLLDFEAKIAATSELRAGTKELLAILQTRGIKTALVTNNSSLSAQTMCEKHGIAFDLVLSRDEASMKPAPDMLLKALQILEVRVRNAIMVGDTQPDAGAAQAAGIVCYLLDEPYNKEILGVQRIQTLLEIKNIFEQVMA